MLRLVITVLLLLPVAHAQAPNAVALTQAKAHFRQGAAFYAAGLYDRAVSEYQAAYQLVPLSDFLFNLAQAHLKRGDKSQALAFYQKYLAADPNGAARAEAQQHVDELKPAVEKERAAADQLARVKADAERAASERAASEKAAADRARAEDAQKAQTLASRAAQGRRRARGEKIAGLAIGAVGIASLILGATFVGLAKQADDEFLHPPGGVYSPSAQDRRGTYQTLDVAFFAVGGAAVATGLALFLVGRHEASRWSVGASVGREGARASLELKF